ncbi:MAG: universal stress protein [Acidimicrobiales bacterium]
MPSGQGPCTCVPTAPTTRIASSNRRPRCAGQRGFIPGSSRWAHPACRDAAHEANHVANLAKRMGQMIGQTVDFDALHEKHVAEDIVDYATRGGASVIAMATHSKTGYKRIFEGSVSMDVVHDAHCPVLVVHPSS